MKKKIKDRLFSGLSALVRKGLVDIGHLEPHYWGLKFSPNGILSFEDFPLIDATEKCSTPFHLYFETRLRKTYEAFSKNGTDVFLSYKTNPIPAQLSYLHSLGAGAEVISPFELWLALKLGVEPEKIVYNGPAKSDESIALAIDKNILLLNFNHFEEISRVRDIAQQKRKKINVGMRVTSSGWAGQFGFSQNHSMLHEAMDLLLATKEFSVVGLHCHRGLTIRNTDDLKSHIDPMLSLCDIWYKRFRWVPKILDFGGSLGVPTVRTFDRKDIRLAWAMGHPPKAPRPEETMSPEIFSKTIRTEVECFFHQRNLPVPRLIVEPGRSLTSQSQLLLTRVIDVRKEKQFHFLITDGGHCHARIAEGEFHQIYALKNTGPARICYRIVGPICHTGDILSRVWYGPPISKGDYLAILDSGAYFVADSSAFSFPRAGAIRFSEEGALSTVRMTETFENLISLDII